MEMYGAKTFLELPDQQQHLLPLNRATWWDIVVLGVALIVFIWEVVMLKRILKPSKTIFEKQSAKESS